MRSFDAQTTSSGTITKGMALKTAPSLERAPMTCKAASSPEGVEAGPLCTWVSGMCKMRRIGPILDTGLQGTSVALHSSRHCYDISSERMYPT